MPEPSQEKATNDEAANHLAGATSPYLLQHVHNPVDWYEWGEEAFAKARDEDLPVFLSIGYAACHWCHVMAHESFESEEVARILNSHFVSIKVDREERPDIDELYMAYTVEATGGGGWPMSVFLTPEGAPFHAGTYYPRPQFIQLLEAVSETWRHEREKITRGAESARNWFQAWSAGPPKAEGVIPLEAVDQTALLLARHFDPQHGGMAGGGTNKFPPSMAMELMLRSYHRTGESDLVTAVETTLDNMARGGIYDHIGGGICRYSTDVEWLVPHFEKMLYDQAMVSSVYLDAYQVSRNPAYSHVAADIFDYVLSDLATEEGGFCSSRDADSDGLEGAYYIWTEEEIVDVLGKEEARLCCDYYDVTASGNWFERFGHAPAGPKNVLRILKPAPVFAREHDMSVEEFETRVDKWRRALAEARSRRTPPGLDDKVLASWNGLMIASLAKGAQVLHEPRYLDAAKKAAAFVTERMMKDGRLFRSYRAGRARYTGYLDDYAFMVAGLLNIFEACGDPAVLKQAKALTDTTIEHFADAKRGGFYFTASDGEALIARSRSPRDGVIPSGNSVMAENLLRLAILVNEPAYRERAEGVFKAFASQVGDSPAAFEHLLCAADFYHDRVKEVVVIGDRSSQDTRDLLNVVHGRYLPNKVVIVADRADDVSPLLEGKAARDGKATAYVCEQYRCQAPTQEVAELRRQLFREP